MVVWKIFNALIQAATCTLLNDNNEVINWAIYNCTWPWPTSTCNDSFKLSEISDYPRLIVTCTFLTVCLLCIYLAYGRQTFIAVFNNMRTLKFKAQLMIEFFAAVNHNNGDSQWTLKHRNKQNGSKSTITTERCHLLTRLKWTSVSREVRLDDWWQQKKETIVEVRMLL